MNALVLTGSTLDDFEEAVVATLLAGSEHRVCGSLIDNRPAVSKRDRLRHNLQRGRGGYVVVMAVKAMGRSRERRRAAGAFFAEHRIPTIETSDPYSDESIARIRALQPDVLLLIGGHGIVRSPLLDVAPEGVLSYHHGDIRRYRGQPPGFWELYNGEREMGVTVQRLNEHLDAGEPIVERRIEIRPDDTLHSLTERALTGSTDMMRHAIEQIASPAFERLRVDSLGPLYTLPNLRQWILFNLKIRSRLLRTRMRRYRVSR